MQAPVSLCPVGGQLSRSLSYVGGYDDSVATDAEDADRLPGGRSSFGSKSHNETAPGRAKHGDRVSPYGCRGRDSGELGQHDRIAALHGTLKRRGDHGRHGRAPDGCIGRRRDRQRHRRTGRSRSADHGRQLRAVPLFDRVRRAPRTGRSPAGDKGAQTGERYRRGWNGHLVARSRLFR